MMSFKTIILNILPSVSSQIGCSISLALKDLESADGHWVITGTAISDQTQHWQFRKTLIVQLDDMNHLLTQQCRPTALPTATSLPDGSETKHAPWHSTKSMWQRAQRVDQIKHLWDFPEQRMEKPSGNNLPPYSKYLPLVSTSARHHQAS